MKVLMMKSRILNVKATIVFRTHAEISRDMWDQTLL